ncbi:GDP-L-fucose synthase [Lentisphaera profundi]|uniref:GDP-L-fucose synthase n=1 Tax=Lentisphaera profundi TaxID=1658616 RepID=A0ABY7VPK7_9BACT|nr:GDP-L-fucose synthase [Lentisphaera profundi]WDE96093.1 GDP-L-fucose synthase [Lentisphaera profundi]
MSPDSKIYIAGHKGMVGSAIQRQLEALGFNNIITRSRQELDLLNQAAVAEFFIQEKPAQVYLAAAKVGGIVGNNTYPAQFIYENLTIQNHIIHNAYLNGCKKLIFLGSSCIYPKMAPQPMVETELLQGSLEPTNEPYAIAKIAGIKTCESYNRQYGVDYRSVMPTNLYGTNDNFHPQNSHVIPAMLRRFHEATESNASEVVVWGTGKPMREFLHVDDMAAASIFVAQLAHDKYEALVDPRCSHINVGSGIDCTIRELAETIAKVVGFKGDLVFDISKPDGAPRKLMNVDRLKDLGWSSQISLEEGLQQTYSWFLENALQLREA